MERRGTRGKWINELENDLQPLAALPDEKVIVEISSFEIRNFRRATYTLARIRAPFLEVSDRDDFDDWVALLPRAMWAKGFRALAKEPSQSIVRRLSVQYMPEVPPFQIIMCPHWLMKLRWRRHPDNWLVYLDSMGKVVARVVWWRDGGPVDVEDDVKWGEGVYLTVTAAGATQLESICGALSITTHVRRKVRPASADGDSLAQSASSRD